MYPPNQPQQPGQWQGNQPPITNYPPSGPMPVPPPSPEWQQWQQQPCQQGIPPQYQPPQQPLKK